MGIRDYLFFPTIFKRYGFILVFNNIKLYTEREVSKDHLYVNPCMVCQKCVRIRPPA